MVNCKVCDKEFKSEKSLHAHIKCHDLRLAEYYQKYHARRDLFSGDLIKFKSKEYYLSTDFNNRTNLRKWLEDQADDEKKKYCENILKARIKKKNLFYAPSQVELRSVMSPPVQYYNRVFGDYNDLCNELGLKNKFDKLTDETIEETKPPEDCKIYIDTREQKPFKFDVPFEIKTLKFGDYALSDKKVSGNCYIERKSLNDFIGTMSGGYDRFRREIERAITEDAYLVVLVERCIEEAMNFNKLPYVSSKIRATPEYIFNRVRSLNQDFKNIQFLFAKTKTEAMRLCKKIFFSNHCFKKRDLQLAYDLKVL
jgi:hypothetical protein